MGIQKNRRLSLRYSSKIFPCRYISQDGVILGADKRATKGPIVRDKNCEKIHYMAPNIYCCGAGTTVDTKAVTGLFIYLFIYWTQMFLKNLTRHGQFATAATLISLGSKIKGCHCSYSFEISPFQVTFKLLWCLVELMLMVHICTLSTLMDPQTLPNCYNGFWFPCCNGYFRVEVSRRLDRNKELVVCWTQNN